MDNPRVQELAAEAWKWLKVAKTEPEKIAEIARVLGILHDQAEERYKRTIDRLIAHEDRIRELELAVRARDNEIWELKQKLVRTPKTP